MRAKLVVMFACLLGWPMAHAQSSATPWIGLALAREASGVLVERVFDDTPAERAGLRAGDRVLAIDDLQVATPGELIGRIQQRGVGERVTLQVQRAGKRRNVTLALEPRPDELSLVRGHLIGKPAPGFALASVGPHRARLGELAGKVVVIEFWATWCGPCNSSLPRLSGWQERYGARGLRVVGVSSEPLELVAKHVAGRGLRHTLAHDTDSAMSEAYRVPAVPTFVVIDRQGKVRFVDVGAGSRLDAVEAAFLPLLGEG